MDLIATAETAQDIAAGLNKFLEPVSESSTEITGLIAECFGISSTLRELSDAVGDLRQNRRYLSISEDVRMVLLSLNYTFDDVRHLFGGLARTNHITLSSGYRQVWRDIETFFQGESRNTLGVRLEYYKTFLVHLVCIIIEGSSPDDGVFDDLQERIEVLLEVQELRLENDFDDLSLGVPGAGRQRSFERRRPSAMAPGMPFPARGAQRRRPSDPPRRDERRPSDPHRRRAQHLRRARTPADEFNGIGLDDDYEDYPPAPDVPGSPTTTTTFSQSSSTSSSIQHWVPKLFEQSQSNTPFRTTGPVYVASS
ncbi:hypothetical protein MMC07_005212 [Pseudocyphellaria aurata]|nr:hypothetical protein [Pseudocyphellaria aurata]